MNGKLATGLEEIADDLSALKKGGFWAVIGNFEGKWILARFSKVVSSELPRNVSWIPIAPERWESSFDVNGYCRYVNQIQEEIAAGGVYQVNACRTLSVSNPDNKSLLGLAARISESNPAKFASYICLPDLQIASASPERFISLTDRTIVSSPIKGTSATENFLEKDHAENLMIVDLIRNDLGAIAKIGTVTTPRLLDTEKHPGLFHLVSDVKAEIADGLDITDVLKSIMPPGSVSGAPKSSALKVIQQWEGRRDIYCGTIGWLDMTSNLGELAVAIRTFWQRADGVLKFGTGAGITWGSQAQQEWEETELKARRLISIAGGVKEFA